MATRNGSKGMTATAKPGEDLRSLSAQELVSRATPDVNDANLFAVEPLTLKVKRLSIDAKLPAYQSAGAAAFDLHAINQQAIAPGRAAVVDTGIAVEVPEGYVMLVFSRSGHGFKSGVRLANSVGVIDSDYRGEIMVKLHNDSSRTFNVEPGDRVAQAMLVPVPRVALEWADDLGETERGANGVGSTGG